MFIIYLKKTTGIDERNSVYSAQNESSKQLLRHLTPSGQCFLNDRDNENFSLIYQLASAHGWTVYVEEEQNAVEPETISEEVN